MAELKVKCSCGPEHFKSPETWREHYEKGKPSDALARRDYVKAHQIENVVVGQRYVSPNGPVRDRSSAEQQDVLQRLRDLSRREEVLRGELMEVELRRDALLRELEPAPVVARPDWVKGDYKGTCTECGSKTFYRFRGIFRCQGNDHKSARERRIEQASVEMEKIMEVLAQLPEGQEVDVEMLLKAVKR